MDTRQPTFDFQQLNLLTEDDPEFRKELLDSYQSSFMRFPAEYAQALDSGRADELQFLIHRVKPSVRMVGADELDRILDQSPRLAEADADPVATVIRVHAICAALVEQLQGLYLS